MYSAFDQVGKVRNRTPGEAVVILHQALARLINTKIWVGVLVTINVQVGCLWGSLWYK